MIFTKKQFIEFEKLIIAATENDKTVRGFSYLMDVVTAKCSALLTHVSIMTAAGAFFSSTTDSYFQYAFLTETIIYIMISFALLFTINMMTPDLKTDISQHLIEASWWRASLYNIALKGTMIATAALLVTLILKLAQ